MARPVFGPVLGRASGGAAALLLMTALPDAHAQDMDASEPLQGEPAALFEPTPLSLGSATVRIGGSARLEYDSNIYAQAFGEKDDFRLQFRDGKSVVTGKSVSVRVDLGVRRSIKNKITKITADLTATNCKQ